MSTTAVLIYLLHHLTGLLQTNEYVHIIALNFSKVFDMVKHCSLVNKLANFPSSSGADPRLGHSTNLFQADPSLVLYSSSYIPLLSVLSYLILQQTTTSMLMILNFSYHSQLWISLITLLILKTL